MPPTASSSPRIVMTVNNPGSQDNRVVRAAEAASIAGYDVHVVGLLAKGFTSQEQINGVNYHRVSLASGRIGMLLEMIHPSLSLMLINFLLEHQARKARLASHIQPVRHKTSATLKTDTYINHYNDRAHGNIKAENCNLGLRYLMRPGLGSFIFSRYREFFCMLSVSILYRIRKYQILIQKQLDKNYRNLLAAPRRLALRIKANVIHHANCKTISGMLSERQTQALRATNRSLKKLIQNAPNTSTTIQSPAEKASAGDQMPGPITRFFSKFATRGPEYMQGRYLLAFFPKLKDLNADIYYAHELPTLAVCSLAAKHHNAKLVYDSHELEPHRNANWSPATRLFWTKRERNLIGDVDEVITVSYSLANELMKMYGLDRVTVVRNTTPLDFAIPEKDIRSSLGLHTNVPLVVFVGLLSFNRGLDLVLEALTHLPGYHVATVGPVNNRIMKETIGHSERLGVGDRLHIHAKVPYRELVNFLSTADLSVIPFKNTCRSHFCLLPNKLFESVFAGLPVVASNFPDLALFLEETQAGVVFEPDDIHDLARKIKNAYINRNWLMSPEKVQKIRLDHCYEREALKLHALFGRLGFPCPVSKIAHLDNTALPGGDYDQIESAANMRYSHG